jgi:hypothetical protein
MVRLLPSGSQIRQDNNKPTMCRCAPAWPTLYYANSTFYCLPNFVNYRITFHVSRQIHFYSSRPIALKLIGEVVLGICPNKSRNKLHSLALYYISRMNYIPGRERKFVPCEPMFQIHYHISPIAERSLSIFRRNCGELRRRSIF